MEALEGRALLSLAGSPDLTFGTDGYAKLPLSLAQPPYASYVSRASVLQPDGDLVVVGELSGMSVGTVSESNHGWFAVRYTADGALDPAFSTTALEDASGLGYSSNPTFPTPGYTGAIGVALQFDSKILVVGDIDGAAKAIRLDSDGTLDTTFGTGGILNLGSVGASTTLGYVASVAVLPGGQIVLSGAVQLTPGQDSPAVEVLNADGSVDTGYGVNGLAIVPLPANVQKFAAIAPVLTDYSYSNAGLVPLAVQPNGDVDVVALAVASGTGSTEVVATRLNAAGAIDSTFGTEGETTITPQSIFPDSPYLDATAVALQPDGKLILGGSISYLGQYRLAVLRLGTNGILDPSFGNDGVNVLAQDTGAVSGVGAIALQADGKIVVANQNATDFGRLDPDGLPDITFGGDGRAAIYDNPNTLESDMPYQNQAEYQYGTVGLAITSDGNILATEQDGVGGLRLLLGQGAVNDFDGDGLSDRAIYINSLGDFAYTPSSGGIGPVVNFGPAGVGQSLPAPGAYEGEGVDELAIYSPAFGAFAIDPLNGGAPVLAPFGIAGAGQTLPAPGDYDASGATELGVYLVNQGIYAYRPADGGADVYVSIGKAGAGQSIPVPADYFGTGQDDVAVYEPSTASYVLRDPANGQTYTIPFGIPGAGNSIPVPGDYDGSGFDELAVYLPSLGDLIYRPANGGPDVIVSFGIPGAGITLPAPGDYDGSGKTEVAAYLPTLGIFAYRPADGGADVYENIGIPNQTIPYTLASATDAGGSGSPSVKFAEVPSVEIPLTQDMLDALASPTAKKKAATA